MDSRIDIFLGSTEVERKIRLPHGWDLREYAKATQRRLLIGILLLLFLVGDGLIFVFYGKEAGVFGLICTAIAIAPLILIFGSLWLFGWVARRGIDD